MISGGFLIVSERAYAVEMAHTMISQAIVQRGENVWVETWPSLQRRSLAEIGPVQEVLDAHDGVVNVH